MNVEEYFKDLTNELSSLKDRVRHYIDQEHWLSDGEWKESVIRTILRRHLPSNIGVGRGFILNIERASTQIDVLLYDKLKPILFQDGDFIIITPDVARGVIEIKTKIWNKRDLRKALNKLCDISQFVQPTIPFNEKRFFGLFAYELSTSVKNSVLDILHDCVNTQHQRIINCISLGNDFFVRYWQYAPISSVNDKYYNQKWHSYHLKNKAPAYFIHNVVDHLCPQWASDNNDIWYPEQGKESYKISEKFLFKSEQIT
ncbi:MAG: DUF6602 domain-containing protein [Syntrophales bacterium]|jgi:hypothetical protein